MIPKLGFSDRTANYGRDQAASPFVRGRNERAFRLLVDDQSLCEDDLASSIVRGLVGHPLLHAKTTSTDHDPHLEVRGPFADTDSATVEKVGTLPGATYVRFASQKRALADQFLVSGENIEAVTERVILVDDAELSGCDAFVTTRKSLLAIAAADIYPGANILTPREAVALVGRLFLRLRQDFAYFHSGRSSASYGKRGFYQLLSHDLLPAARRAGCKDQPSEDSSASISRLAGSVLIRIERALLCARPHPRASPSSREGFWRNEDALFYLDAFLFSLAGAFDAIARIVRLTTSNIELGLRRAKLARSPETQEQQLDGRSRD